MTDADETPYAQNAPSRHLAELRLRAEESVNREDDEGLLGLSDDLRADHELWAHLWAPALAIATARTQRPGGVTLLEEAASQGFAQPELFEGQLEEHFATLPEWDAIRSQMVSNVPAPPLELLAWPDPPAAVPLLLDRLPADREGRLRARLPEPAASAWLTATGLLAWVRRRWDHANDHVEDPDALDVLDRVDAGEQFACVEYSIVLSQALNAVQIPARRVGLLQPNHHTGIGRGHVVSEAWIDDLGRWVVLDGQNGAYWADETGAPMGVLELQRAYADHQEPASMVSVVPEKETASAEVWWRHFANARTTGYAWAAEPSRAYCPIFQGTAVTRTGRLLHDPGAAYPDLDTPAVGIGGDLAQPAITLSTVHPYARGFTVTEQQQTFEVGTDHATWVLRGGPGVHEAQVAVRTPYGTGRPAALRYRRSRG